MKQMQVKITGSVVSVFRKMGTKDALWRRRVVEPEWIELWYKIQADEFDESLWLRLNDADREFLIFCVNASHIENRAFNIAVAKSQKATSDELKIIEGELLSGNLNKTLVSKYNKIIDMLTETMQMGKQHGTLLKNRMQRSYEALLKKNNEVNWDLIKEKYPTI